VQRHLFPTSLLRWSFGLPLFYTLLGDGACEGYRSYAYCETSPFRSSNVSPAGIVSEKSRMEFEWMVPFRGTWNADRAILAAAAIA